MDVRFETSVPETEYFPTVNRRRGPSLWLATILKDRAEMTHFWPVVTNMVIQELRVRYHRSMLGFLWTLLHPVLMMTILTLVFSHLFKNSVENYAVYLFAGMVPWNFLSGSLNDSAFCIIHNEGLIRKIYIPKLVFPLAKVLINLTTFGLSLVALFVLLKPMGAQFSFALLALPVVIVLFFTFTLGICLIVAVSNTFFRDTGHLVSVFLQAWYFATPIIYQTKIIEEQSRWRFWLNPAFPFIRMFQVIVHDGHWPSWPMILMASAIATVSLGVGYAAFKSVEDKLVFRL